jgi:site-specific DNA-methyltransferase (adenine-specific)
VLGVFVSQSRSRGGIFWDKGVANDFTLSPGELAWTSYPTSIKKVELLWAGFRKCEEGKRIHPTQKPVKLYEWLLANYASNEMKILDTHLGSGSSAIAAHYGGFDFVGCELDEDYYKAAKARFDNETAQRAMF